MNEKILMLIDKIINGLMEEEINALYELMIERDYDYIPDLFVNKDEFEDFIEKYKDDCKCGAEKDNV